MNARAKPATKSTLDDSFLVAHEKPLVPPGEYQLRYLFYETARLHGGSAGKVIVWFRMLDMGPLFGTEIARYYNAEVLTNGRRRGGKFKAGFCSDLMREYALVRGLPYRKDRLTLAHMRDRIIIGRVGTVTRGSRQRRIHESLQYSVVEELLSVLT